MRVGAAIDASADLRGLDLYRTGCARGLRRNGRASAAGAGRSNGTNGVPFEPILIRSRAAISPLN